MKVTKLDVWIFLTLLFACITLNLAHQNSSLFIDDHPYLRRTIRSLSDSLPIFRLKEEITSYKQDKDLVKLSLIPETNDQKVASVLMHNYQTNVKYKYIEGLSYPSGNYEVTLFPVNSDKYLPTSMSGTFKENGSHAVHYSLVRKPSPKPKHNLNSLNSLNSTAEEKTRFVLPLESTQERLEFASDSPQSIAHSDKLRWVSGKVIINTTPKNATIELLSEPGKAFTNGMTFEKPYIKVKVSAPNYIFTIKKFKLSTGTNIFVLPLQRMK
ncbi:hypothetical protein BWH99_RS10975 [Vibrio parahaemolyticus]|nr:hypothetical protein [Vibrio parahaemolyticus]EIA9324834.1 hypothetical protein [Vibrio parahaemolyticus]EJG1681458.1 hypothetical protein [Vibrio parahaemolyticus]